MRAVWRPLIEGRGWNPTLREQGNHNSGVYAIRRKSDRVVVYVGESHTGRLWKTLQRHFQKGTGAFSSEREWTAPSPAPFEAALWITSRGERAKKNGDQRALNAQAAIIKRLKPTDNVDDGLSAEEDERCPHGTTSKKCIAAHRAPVLETEDDDFAFGANVQDDDDHAFGELLKRNPGKRSSVPVDAPPERRAENRTPDLFTGRTRLEERGGGARHDWKGEAARLSKELEACKRSSGGATSEARVVETDEKGQIRMFRNNPAAAVPSGERASDFLFAVRPYYERPPKVVDMRDGTFEFREEGRVTVYGVRSKEWIDWIYEALQAAATDAAIHTKVSSSVPSPPKYSPRNHEQVIGFKYESLLSGAGGVLLSTRDVEGSENVEQLCSTDTAYKGRLIAELGAMGLQTAQQFAAARASEEDRQRHKPKHALKVGDFVRGRTASGYVIEGVISAYKGESELLLNPNAIKDGKRWDASTSPRTVYADDVMRTSAPQSAYFAHLAAPAKPSKKNKKPTFKEKSAELLSELEALGWKVDRSLKTPHATDRDKEDRLWFKSQAIYVGTPSGGERGARSLVSDMRDVPSGAALEALVKGHASGHSPSPPSAPVVRPARPLAASVKAVVSAVEAGPAHSLAVDAAPFPEQDADPSVSEAINRGLIRVMPARGRWPRRYVVTSSGSHFLGSFDSDDRDFREDSRRLNAEAAQARKVAEAAKKAAAAAEKAAEAKRASEAKTSDAERKLEALRRQAAKPARGGGKAKTLEQAGQLRLINPATLKRGQLVELGRLTQLAWSDDGRRRVRRWGINKAPILAYDCEGKLSIVYGATKVGMADPGARRAYSKTHWGQIGTGALVQGGRLEGLDGVRKLGPCLEVTYTTRKGFDRELVDYWHEFGEGARGKWIPPVLVIDPKLDAMRLDGGSYVVTERGIVG